MELSTGDLVLDRYRIVNMLAEGGMGRVYRGEQTTLGFPVAIKTLLAPDDIGLQTRFVREARLMASVRHPNIVSILDFGHLNDGQLCIVMEFAPGLSLGELLIKNSSFDWPRALQITEDILSGLEALHKAQIIHRDMKPDNVVMVGPRGSEVAKILDLGIARSMDQGLEKITKTGLIMGSPHYMAPEQILTSRVEEPADIFSVGAILFEMLAGDLPWEIASIADLVRRVHEPVAPLVVPASNMQPPEELHQLLRSTLAPDPNDRIQTAGEFAAACAAIRRGAEAEPFLTLKPAPANPPSVTSPEKTKMGSGPYPSSARRPQPRAPSVIAVEPEIAATPQRAVVAARLPAARLRNRADREWLASKLTDNDRGYSLGAEIWFAVLGSPKDDQRMDLQKCILDRYSDARVVSAMANDEFLLTAAALTGAVPLPQPLRRMVTSLLER